MKKLLALLMIMATVLIAGCGGGDDKKAEKKDSEEGILNLYSWADNFDPALIEKFEKENNVKVNYDVFANNEEMLAKIMAGGAQYDLIQFDHG